MVTIPKGFKLILSGALIKLEYNTIKRSKSQACKNCPIRYLCYTTDELDCIINHIGYDYEKHRIVWNYPNRAIVKSHLVSDSNVVSVSPYWMTENLIKSVNTIGQLLLDIYLENGLEWVYKNKLDT